MSIEALLDHTCDIYHIIKSAKSPGYSLPASPRFDYPETPDEPRTPCHFSARASFGTVSVTQGDPQNDLEAKIKLILPRDADVRLNDKIVDCGAGLEYTAEQPRGVRNHHIFVYVKRTREQQPL
jgi:hypothetical protein